MAGRIHLSPGSYLRCTLQIKDYYSILDIPPTASAEEIKKAFRKLAHKYHPDKKDQHGDAGSGYPAIREAYETLSNPAKREIYLSQRWYARSQGQKFNQEPGTPAIMLKRMLHLEQHVTTLDVFRMDYEGVLGRMHEILCEEDVAKLRHAENEDSRKEICLTAIRTGSNFPLSTGLKLTNLLKPIIGEDADLEKHLNRYISDLKRNDFWEKQKGWVILFVSILICVGIYLTSK